MGEHPPSGGPPAQQENIQLFGGMMVPWASPTLSALPTLLSVILIMKMTFP